MGLQREAWNLWYFLWPAEGISTGCKVQLHVSVWEKENILHLIYYLSKQFLNDFMV